MAEIENGTDQLNQGALVILEKPYVSAELLQYLQKNQIPVLENEMANEMAKVLTSDAPLSLVSEEEASEMLRAGAKLYTTSENALDWVSQHSENKELLFSIGLMKDKAAFRRALSNFYPDFFYREVGIEQLSMVSASELKLPCILKPSIGFFSVGVYTILQETDWETAVSQIKLQSDEWKRDFPETVVANEVFLIEEYITGDEYALDMYYDHEGKATILNVMKHEFSGMDDVSDRLYVTGKQILKDHLSTFTEYLDRVNQALQFKDVPVHVELRMQGSHIFPIEFNPLRFAGWCTTDLVRFAFGLNTVEYYLLGKKPDWDELLKGTEGSLYSLVVLDKPSALTKGQTFDYSLFCERMPEAEVLCLRMLDPQQYPTFGFLFVRTEENDRSVLDRIMRADMAEFLKKPEGICYIVGAGSFNQSAWQKSEGDYLIAADGGYRHLEAIGLTPDLLLGDFDSIGTMPNFPNLITLPVEKDETDLYFAVNHGLSKGFRRFVIYGGLGGRLDHSLANLQTLVHLAKSGAESHLVGEGTIITAIHEGTLRFPAGMTGTLSVFSAGDKAEGVHLVGLKYPLKNAVLTNRMPLGVSNEFTEEAASVTVGVGTLLVMWQEQPTCP